MPHVSRPRSFGTTGTPLTIGTTSRLGMLIAVLGLVSACAMTPARPTASEAPARARSVTWADHFLQAKAAASSPAGLPALPVALAKTGSGSPLPLYFEVNQGQAGGRVEFISRGPSHTLFLTSSAAVLAMPGSGPGEARALRLSLAGANAGTRVEGMDALAGRVNYFIGNDPRAWRTDIPTYASVKYRDVYPGVDLVYHGRQGQLEFDFVVAPHADPARIRLSLEGPGEFRLDERGDLVLGAGAAEVRLRKPVIYQEIDGARREIAGRYVPTGKGAVGFAVADYDRRLALVIDPILQATYIGGTSNDNLSGTALDTAGNIYIAGSTNSFDYPVLNAFQGTNTGLGVNGACFITKLNPSGSALVYSTYLAGNGDNACFGGVVVDGSGSAYVTGPTTADNFPVTASALQSTRAGDYDVFVTRLSPAGNSLLYSTYLGGGGFDNSRGLAVDGAGNVWVSGMTRSTNFPVKNATQAAHANDGGNNDGFVTKIDTNQSGFAGLVFSTYFGGNGTDHGSGNNVGGGLALDPSGNVIVTADTNSSDLATTAGAFQPLHGGGFDGFVLKLGPGGNKIYASYIGGPGNDPAFTIAVDGAGNAYVAGSTNGVNFPLKNPLQGTFGGGSDDAYLIKVDPSGQLIFSTFLGGNGPEFPGRVAVDRAGNAYLTGNTGSTANFPLVAPVQSTYGGGSVDAWIMLVNPTGTAIAFSTYIGGFGGDTGFGIVPDPSGNVYVGIASDSPNLPVVTPFQAGLQGGSDAYVVKLSLPGGLVASLLPISRAVATGGTATVFATIINSGADEATGCTITPVSQLPITSLYQTTNRFTNELTGTPNTPANIAVGDFQTFLIAITVNGAFSPNDISFSFGCANRPSATVIAGVNTMLLSASDVPGPDIVALGATPSLDGIVNIPGASGTGILGVATSNVGAGASIIVTPDTGTAVLPVTLLVCETTGSPTGACVSQLGSSVPTTMNAGATQTFAVFAVGTGTGTVAFDPAVNRLFLRFRNAANNHEVGATSGALRTQ